MSTTASITKAQRNAILEAHGYRVNHPNGQRDGHVATKSGARNQMILRMICARLLDTAGRVTRAALVAAGVDLDAIHTEALKEDSRRDYAAAVDEMREQAAAQATPAYRHFLAALRRAQYDGYLGVAYRAALDVLHAEALADHAAAVDEKREQDALRATPAFRAVLDMLDAGAPAGAPMVDAPRELDEVRPGVIVSLRPDVHVLVTRVDLPSAPENVGHRLWVTGTYVNADGSPAVDAAAPALEWVGPDDIAGVRVTPEKLEKDHADALEEWFLRVMGWTLRAEPVDFMADLEDAATGASYQKAMDGVL
jgi:hypothetical protein